MPKYLLRLILLCSLIAVVLPAPGLADPFATVPLRPPQGTAVERDGSHDFDFQIGSWKTHLKRLVHPLSGSTTWVELDGTSVVRKLWNGGANLIELEVSGPSGHIEGLSLQLYRPQSRQWTLNFANSADPSLGEPTVGQFKNGRGEFYDEELFNGRAIFVRFVISDITPNSCHFEQAFSDDGGKTWEVNWIADDTRIPEGSQPVEVASQTTAEQNDFAFELGSWKIHLSRLDHPLTGSKTWIDFDGTSVTQKVWNGRAEIEQFETDNATGRVEGLTLRLYNPKSHQWSLYWANSKDGLIGQPTIGEFKNGHGEFFDQEPFNGRAILVRYIWSNITPNSAHFEQSFSEDGGKTWEVNWITDQTRVNNETAKAQ